LTVRFRGICCFIDQLNGQRERTFEKRVVLPNGGKHEHMGIEKHLPIIEFFAEDLIERPADMAPVPFTRPGDDGMYQYIELTEPVSITLRGTTKGNVRESLSLAGSVIHLDKLVPKPAELRDSLLGDPVKADAALVMAVMDLPTGELASGPPEGSFTEFPMSPNFKKRRVGRWLEHTVALPDDETICLELTPLGQKNATKQILFKNTTSMITIANEPLRLIVGKFVQKPNGETEGLTPNHTMKTATAESGAKESTNGNGAGAHQGMPSTNGGSAQGTAHFNLYWELMKDPPTERPRPASSQGSGPSCSPAIKP
jgi:hypothetical protein